MDRPIRPAVAKPVVRPTTEAEFDILQQQVIARDQQLREQTEALRREREEVASSRTQADDMSNILAMLKQLQTDITPLKRLPERLNNLESQIANASQTASECSEPPEVRTYEPVPSLKIKDVLPTIPNYDGHKISVFQFARSCQRARDLLPHQYEPQLVQLIINKLEGDAYQVVDGSYFETLTDLLDKLKSIFAPHKTVSQYRGELANIFKNNTESILQYAGRIKDLKTAILDTNRRQRGHNDLTFTNEIDDEVLEAFVNGLPTEIITRIEHRRIETLDQAIEWAIKLSRTIQTERERVKIQNPRYNEGYRQPRADLYNPSPTRDKPDIKILRPPPPTFQNSKFKPFIKPLTPGRPGPNYPLTCRYCKTPGHDISACRKLAARNAQENASAAPATSSANRGKAQNNALPPSTPGPSREAPSAGK